MKLKKVSLYLFILCHKEKYCITQTAAPRARPTLQTKTWKTCDANKGRLYRNYSCTFIAIKLSFFQHNSDGENKLRTENGMFSLPPPREYGEHTDRTTAYTRCVNITLHSTEKISKLFCDTVYIEGRICN